MCACCRQTAYQSTTLPFVPGVVTRTTSIPPMGDLHLLYPETFGGVSFSNVMANLIDIRSSLFDVFSPLFTSYMVTGLVHIRYVVPLLLNMQP